MKFGPRLERIDGPTEHGAAYAIVTTFEDGTVHVTEYDEEDRWLFETVGVPERTADGPVNEQEGQL